MNNPYLMAIERIAPVAASGKGLHPMLIAIVLCLLALCPQATATTLNFDSIPDGESLYDQFAAQGVLFRDQLVNGNSPGVIKTAEDGRLTTLQPNSSSAHFYILFSQPIFSFSFSKWEPLVETPSEPPPPDEGGGPTTEAPTGSQPTEDYTVHNDFYHFTGGDYVLLGSTQNSDKGSWVTMSYNSAEGINAVGVWGDITNNKAYYLDDIQFDSASNPVSAPDASATAGLLAVTLAGLVALRRRLVHTA